MRQLLGNIYHFMETASPFPGGKHGLAKVYQYQARQFTACCQYSCPSVRIVFLHTYDIVVAIQLLQVKSS